MKYDPFSKQRSDFASQRKNNDYSYEEMDYQTFYHDVLIYIQGIEVSDWVAGSLNVTYALNENYNTASFTLANDNFRWVLTEQNVGKGITTKNVKDTSKWLPSIDDAKKAMVINKMAISEKLNEKRIDGILDSVTKHVQQYIGQLIIQRDQKQYKTLEQRRKQTKLKHLKEKVVRLKKASDQARQAYDLSKLNFNKTPDEKKSLANKKAKALALYNKENAKLNRLNKGQPGFFDNVAKGAKEANKKAAIDKAARSGKIPTDELGISSLVALLSSSFGTMGYKYIDPSAAKGISDARMKQLREMRRTNSKHFQNFSNYALQIANDIGNITGNTNKTLNRFVQAIVDGGLKDKSTPNNLTAKGIVYSTYMFYVTNYRNPAIYGVVNPVDLNIGQEVYTFTPKKCVINKNDPIRIFAHNPYTQNDEWKPIFTGYIENVEIVNGYTDGIANLQVNCYDIRALMNKMRVQMNPVIGNITPEALLTDTNNFFKDLIFASSKGSHPFARASLEGAIRILVTGGDITQLQRESSDAKQLVADKKKQQREIKNKKLNKIYNDLQKKTLKKALKTDDNSILNNLVLDTKALNNNITSGIGTFKHGFTIQTTPTISKEGKAIENTSSLRKWHQLCLFGVLTGTNLKALNKHNLNNSGVFPKTYTKQYLTRDQVVAIGSLTKTGEPFDPSAGYLHFMLPFLGSGVRDSVEYNRIGHKQSYEWRTRLQLIGEMCEAVDYKFFVSPAGDICVEFPQYDFQPVDYGDRGGLIPMFTIDRMITDSGAADEKSEITTGIVVQGGRTNAGESQQEVNQGGRYNNLRIFGISPTMAGRYGVTTKTVTKNWLSDYNKLRDLAKVEYIKSLLEANELSVGFAGHYELWLNRPLLSKADLRMGTIDNISLTYNLNEAVIQQVGLTYVRSLGNDGKFRFISGGDVMPYSYKNNIETTTVYDGRGNIVEQVSNEILTNKFGNTKKSTGNTKETMVKNSGTRFVAGSLNDKSQKKEIVEEKTEKKKPTRPKGVVDNKGKLKDRKLSTWESTYTMQELKDMMDKQWYQGKTKEGITIPRSRMVSRGRTIWFPRGTGVPKTGFGGKKDPAVLKKEWFKDIDIFKKRFDLNNGGNYGSTKTLKGLLLEQMQARYKTYKKYGNKYSSTMKTIAKTAYELYAAYIGSGVGSQMIFKYGNVRREEYFYNEKLPDSFYLRGFPKGITSWKMSMNTLWNLANGKYGKYLIGGERTALTREIASKIPDDDWVCALPLKSKYDITRQQMKKVGYKGSGKNGAITTNDVKEWWANRLIICNYGEVYWVTRAAEVRATNGIVELQHKPCLNSITKPLETTMTHDITSEELQNSDPSIIYPNQRNSTKYRYWVRTSSGAGFERNFIGIMRIAFLDETAPKAGGTIDGKYYEPGKDPRLGLGYIRSDGAPIEQYKFPPAESLPSKQSRNSRRSLKTI